MALIITGNPGVGKHTIAKSVSKKINHKILDINKIALESKLFKKNDESIDVDIKKLKSILKNKIKKNSIIVGHLAPYVITKKQVTLAIILRKNPYKLTVIYKKRRYSTKKISENIGSEILGITAYDSIKKFGKNKCHQIDTTSKTISKITKTVIDIIDGKFESDTVDWLTLISNKNDLQKFFSY